MPEFQIGLDNKGHTVLLNLAMANRHGLIAGATGTGKTVTLQEMAEKFSQAGVCVFSADVKGDLSGIAAATTPNGGNPVVFWDLYGKNGHPIRVTISEIGPLLLARLLKLNDTQQGILNAAFSVADDNRLLLLDLKDLQSLLQWMRENSASLSAKYGNITAASIGAIQRGLLTLQEAGGDQFFGEPSFKIENLFQKDPTGRGIVNILDATQLIRDPYLYSTFLLWLLSALFEQLPEIGDQDKPKLVFFFDEAHLLFNTAPKVLLEKIEQIVRLIRSKGIGVYFVTQSPLDIPENILGQLGNRVQHALRAFTPKDQKAVKAAAETFRENPKLNTAKVIQELSVGEALVSFLDKSGSPEIVERVKINLPTSQLGPVSLKEREDIIRHSPFYGLYEHALDRESAFETLKRNAEKTELLTETKENSPPKIKNPVGRPKDSVLTSLLKSTLRSFSTQAGREIIRGILGSFSKKK
jgi:DNA helicase HerA-like ATPase